MASYRQSKADRAKAAAAAVFVHVLIGAALLTGLATDVARRPTDALRTFDVTEPPPPISEPPPDESEAARDEAAPENLKAVPTPVVAPEPKIPAPTPIPAAPIASTGSAASAGAADVPGPGTGAGGTGTGLGGGGSGAGSGTGFTPARRITKIPDREYRRIVATSGIRRGSVALTVRVNTDGRPSDCRIRRSSGAPSVDALMCQLTVQYVRFRPARDPQGRPVAQDITWAPDWSPR